MLNHVLGSNNEAYCAYLSNFHCNRTFNANLYIANRPTDARHAWTELHRGHPAITFNLNFIDSACGAEIALTLLHEGIHADVIRRLEAARYDLVSLRRDYPILAEYYISNDPDWHHEYMANEVFNGLVDAIEDLYPDRYTVRERNLMAWSGLHKTDAFKLSDYAINDIVSNQNSIRTACETCN